MSNITQPKENVCDTHTRDSHSGQCSLNLTTEEEQNSSVEWGAVWENMWSFCVDRNEKMPFSNLQTSSRHWQGSENHFATHRQGEVGGHLGETQQD